MDVESIKIIAAIFSIAGAAILAYLVTGILSALSFVANWHEVNIKQLMPNNHKVIHNLGNSTEHLGKAQKKGLLITGFIFFVLSGVLQLIALLMTNA